MNDDADSVWKALADPTRRAILDLLRPGPMTTGELAERFDQSRFNVMKHMGVLEHCGLLIVERRGRERWNYLNAARLREATDRWMTSFQLEWSSRLNDLGHALQGLASVPATRQLPTLHVEEVVTCPVSPERLFSPTIIPS